MMRTWALVGCLVACLLARLLACVRVGVMSPHRPALVSSLPCLGEIRGQVVFDNAWDYSRPLTARLSGAAALPASTNSAAAGSVQVVLSKDGMMGVAHGGVSGASDWESRV